MGTKMKRFLEEIGPLLAGFQIAVSIVGFFGIGAIAKWILDNWLPFTRWAWGEFFAFVQLPEISLAEKDALTTLAFFAPMAISSFIMQSKVDVESSETSNIDEGKETRLRIYATLIGAAFMVIIGGRVIQDAITLFTTDAPLDVSVNEESQPLLDVELFANLGLVLVVLIGIVGMALLLYWVSRRNKWLASKTDALFIYLGKRTKPIKKAISIHGVSLTISVMNGLVSLASFGTITGGILYGANQLGSIRTVSPILVLVSLLATIFLNPGRLLRTAGVVIALVLASWGWDIAIWVVRAVETAPVSS